MAHAFIDAIANAGADAVKFQTHIAAAESTAAEPWRIHFSPQDSTRYEYWQRMEFSEEQWVGLRQHAEEKGLLFLSSPFSVEAVHLLQRVGVPAWKLASGEISNVPLFDAVARTQLPVLMSTGMSDLTEIDAAVARIQAFRLPIVVMQCTSAYPCPPERIGLNMLSFYRERYSCDVGLSDHSGTIFPGLAAATIGIEALEIHATFSREMFGPDVSSSLTLDELRTLVRGVRFIEAAMAHPVDKAHLPSDVSALRRMFTKSVVARENLAAGTRLEPQHLDVKKPGTGIPAARLPELIGRRLLRNMREDDVLQEHDLEPAE